ncbi:hypothetical protein C8J56DRAFT_1029027 [Mycena floridula]|nr:hypothetical protein C8J56DRAFT_1029027 [Mycena floridula]
MVESEPRCYEPNDLQGLNRSTLYDIVRKQKEHWPYETIKLNTNTKREYLVNALINEASRFTTSVPRKALPDISSRGGLPKSTAQKSPSIPPVPDVQNLVRHIPLGFRAKLIVLLEAVTFFIQDMRLTSSKTSRKFSVPYVETLIESNVGQFTRKLSSRFSIHMISSLPIYSKSVNPIADAARTTAACMKWKSTKPDFERAALELVADADELVAVVEPEAEVDAGLVLGAPAPAPALVPTKVPVASAISLGRMLRGSRCAAVGSDGEPCSPLINVGMRGAELVKVNHGIGLWR